jgi:hypothetical protein
MRRRTGAIQIFAERELSHFLASIQEEIKATIRSETAEYLLNVNDDEYLQHLLDQFRLEPLQIHFDKVSASPHEEMIPAERFPGPSFIVRAGERYPKQVFRYYIPYEGTEELLKCIPNPRILWTAEVELEDGNICFEIIDFHGDAGHVRGEAERIMKPMGQQLENVKKQVNAYNEQVTNFIKEVITKRKAELQSQIGVAGSLGVPIRKSDHVPETFRIPEVRRKVIPKPTVPEGAGMPEPAIGDDIYQEILKVIHDTGKTFERLPNTYADKDEEALRDHLILQLEPHFEISTTGETFNKSGKTDILMRHENSNVFVAECLWWDGPKMYLEKIDQLLGYLTWRDSKTAIVCFVGRKDFSHILSEITEATRQHSCYVEPIGVKEETWHVYKFHLAGDPGRTIKVAVLAFHLPRNKTT